MSKHSILFTIKQLRRPVFTTRELSELCGKSLSNTVQILNHLEKEGLILKIYRGIWIEIGNERLSPYAVIPFLLPKYRVYVSFITALHLHGIIEQIPQIITLASTVHTKIIRTKIATFSVHRITPSFFCGFNWYKGRDTFLIAEPEKALIDNLYLSARKKKQFRYFPELSFPKSFDFKKAKEWANKISDPKINIYVHKKLYMIEKM